MVSDKRLCAACKGRSKTRGGLNNGQLNNINSKIKYEPTRKDKIGLLKRECKKACQKTQKSKKTKKTQNKKIRKSKKVQRQSKKVSKTQGKKVQKTKKDSKKQFELCAKAYFLVEDELNEKKVSIKDTVPKNQINQVMKDVQVMGTDIMRVSLELEGITDFTITWKQNKIIAKFILKEVYVKDVFESIVNSYHEGAMDGYLEGDNIVYKNYELTFDDFELDGLKAKNYWV